MTPGTLLFDPNFRFHDGDTGKKILICLGTSQGITLVIKTTSQGRRYRNDWGCQNNHIYPCFHLTQGSCCLHKPTWACLDEYYEFRDSVLLQRHFSNEIHRFGTLPDAITEELMRCALESDDINPRQMRIVERALDGFLAG